MADEEQLTLIGLQKKLQEKKHTRKLRRLKYSCEEVYERMDKGLCIFCDELDTPGHHDLKHKGIQIFMVECDDDQVSDYEEEAHQVHETLTNPAPIEENVYSDQICDKKELVSIDLDQEKDRNKTVAEEKLNLSLGQNVEHLVGKHYKTFSTELRSFLNLSSPHEYQKDSTWIESSLYLFFSLKNDRVWEPGGVSNKMDFWDWLEKELKPHGESLKVTTFLYSQMQVVKSNLAEFKTFDRKRSNKTLSLDERDDEHEQNQVIKLISSWTNRIWEPGGITLLSKMVCAFLLPFLTMNMDSRTICLTSRSIFVDDAANIALRRIVEDSFVPRMEEVYIESIKQNLEFAIDRGWIEFWINAHVFTLTNSGSKLSSSEYTKYTLILVYHHCSLSSSRLFVKTYAGCIVALLMVYDAERLIQLDAPPIFCDLLCVKNQIRGRLKMVLLLEFLWLILFTSKMFKSSNAPQNKNQTDQKLSSYWKLLLSWKISQNILVSSRCVLRQEESYVKVLELIKVRDSRKRKLGKNWWFKYKLNAWLSEALHFWTIQNRDYSFFDYMLVTTSLVETKNIVEGEIMGFKLPLTSGFNWKKFIEWVKIYFSEKQYQENTRLMRSATTKLIRSDFCHPFVQKIHVIWELHNFESQKLVTISHYLEIQKFSWLNELWVEYKVEINTKASWTGFKRIIWSGNRKTVAVEINTKASWTGFKRIIWSGNRKTVAAPKVNQNSETSQDCYLVMVVLERVKASFEIMFIVEHFENPLASIITHEVFHLLRPPEISTECSSPNILNLILEDKDAVKEEVLLQD